MPRSCTRARAAAAPRCRLCTRGVDAVAVDAVRLAPSSIRLVTLKLTSARTSVVAPPPRRAPRRRDDGAASTSTAASTLRNPSTSPGAMVGMAAWPTSWSWPTGCGGARRHRSRCNPFTSTRRAGGGERRHRVRAVVRQRQPPSPPSDGLVLVDTGSQFLARHVHGQLRALERPSRCTPPCTPTATSTTSSACPCSRRRRPPTAGPAPRSIAHEALPPPLRPLHPHRRLQRRDQPAPVPGARPALADRVPLPRRDLPRPPPRRGRRARAFELHHARGETDDHTWTWVPEPQGALLRRPVHLGVAQRRQPAEGAALPEGVGRSRCGHGRARRRAAAARPRPARSSAPTGSARRSPTRPTCSSHLARPDGAR